MQPGCNGTKVLQPGGGREVQKGRQSVAAGGNRGEIGEIFSYGDCDQSPRTRGETL
jgi:hypothetical protein